MALDEMWIQPRQLWLHKKTGNLYRIVDEAVDATNARSGTRVVVYTRDDGTPGTYVRDLQEFLEKFEPYFSISANM
jgi:hypothetical protein